MRGKGLLHEYGYGGEGWERTAGPGRGEIRSGRDLSTEAGRNETSDPARADQEQTGPPDRKPVAHPAEESGVRSGEG